MQRYSTISPLYPLKWLTIFPYNNLWICKLFYFFLATCLKIPRDPIDTPFVVYTWTLSRRSDFLISWFSLLCQLFYPVYFPGKFSHSTFIRVPKFNGKHAGHVESWHQYGQRQESGHHISICFNLSFPTFDL